MASKCGKALCSFGVALAFLSAAVTPAACQIERRDGSEDLPKTVNYSSPDLQNDYNASTEYDPHSLKSLYDAAKWFVGVVQSEELYPDGLLEVVNGDLRLKDNVDWGSVARQYSGVLAVVGIALVMAVLLPVVGFCACCCCNLGSGKKTSASGSDTGIRVLLGAALAAISVLCLLGTICAFGSNQTLDSSLEAFPENATTVVNDIRLFIRNTKLEVQSLLYQNFDELSVDLRKNLNSTGYLIAEKLSQISNATALTELVNTLGNLDSVKTDLDSVQKLTASLTAQANTIKSGAQNLKQKLSSAIALCQNLQNCNTGSLNVNDLDFNLDFSLPDVTESLNTVSGLIQGNILDNVKKGEDALKNIREKIETEVDNNTPKINKAITDTGAQISDIAKKILNALDTADDLIQKNADQPLEDMRKYIEDIRPYRYYVELAISCVMLATVTLLVFGVLLSFCDCSKSIGGGVLMGSVWLIFFTSSVITIVVLVHFIVGVVGERAVCDSLRNPSESKFFEVLNQWVSLESIVDQTGDTNGPPTQLTLSSLIISCHDNKSIYTVLDLDPRVNISKVVTLPEQYRYDHLLQELKQNLKYDNATLELLNTDATQQLQKLIQSPLGSINISDFSSVASFQPPSLTDLISLIEQNEQNNPKEVVTVLVECATELKTIQSEIDDLTKTATSLNASAYQLQEDLKFGQTSLEAAVAFLTLKVNDAQDYLRSKGPQELEPLAENVIGAFSGQVNSYLDRVVTYTKQNIGRCGPLSQAYDAAITATCAGVLNPINGFWASVGLCLLLHFIALFVATNLAAIYRRKRYVPYATEVERFEEYERQAIANELDRRYRYDGVPSGWITSEVDRHQSKTRF